MSFWKSLVHVLKSKQTKQAAEFAAPFIPGGPLMLGTLSKLDQVISDAKDGDPAAIETVRAVKLRADLGDPNAQKTVATMTAISKVQNSKKQSLYARGAATISVGHDPWGFVGAIRDQRGGRGGGGGVSVTDLGKRAANLYKRSYSSLGPKAIDGRKTDYNVPWYQRAVERGSNLPPALASMPQQWRGQVDRAIAEQQQQAAQQQQQQQQGDPYGGYGDPYGGYGYPDPYGGYGGGGGGGGYPAYDPYGLYDPYFQQGLPPGYGTYEEPVIDRGGYQQYDESTGMFYSSNQKQVYDEATGMFVPVNAENPYASLYGF